jgi:RNA polymerase sigma-70 factor (ECF subfamily)
MNNQEVEPLATAAQSASFRETREDLAQLFALHHRRILGAACRITGSMADAEDVAQTVFLRLAGGNGPAIENAGSYLYRAAINGALDLLRRRKAAASESLEAAASQVPAGRGSSPESAASSRELGSQLRMAMSDLSPRAAEMFALRYLEDKDNPEIAALLRTSQAVVAVTLHHARSRLKKRLRELEKRNP